MKDLSRTVDYLQTRSDINSKRLVYVGLSRAAAMGPVMVVVEPRLQAAVSISGGLYSRPAMAEVEPFLFAPHVQIPVLMLNGLFRLSKLRRVTLNQMYHDGTFKLDDLGLT